MYITAEFFSKIYTEVIQLFKIEKPEYINKTFRMPVDLVAEMEALAQSKQISLNQLVIQCCKYALNNLDDETE